MRARMLAPVHALALSLTALVGGCSGGGGNEVQIPKSTAEGITIVEPRLVLPIVKDSAGAVYFTIANETDKPQKILSIDVGGTDMAMIHDTIDKGGVSSMQMVQSATVPANGSMVFAPGGRHVMVTGLKPELQAGVNTLLKVNFDNGDIAAVAIPVIPPAAASGN
ncbi:MAG: copper chaperone PCu(A)C [Novosphingobium sp.]